jgi:hypothetical protein
LHFLATQIRVKLLEVEVKLQSHQMPGNWFIGANGAQKEKEVKISLPCPFKVSKHPNRWLDCSKEILLFSKKKKGRET